MIRLHGEEEDGSDAGNQPDTSTHSTGNQSTQESRQHRSEVKGLTAEVPAKTGLNLQADKETVYLDGKYFNFNGVQDCDSDDPEHLVIDNIYPGGDKSEGQSPCDLSIRGQGNEGLKKQQNTSNVSSRPNSNSPSFSSNQNSDDRDHYDDNEEKESPAVRPTSPSLLTDRFCVYCNTMKKSPADLQRHLRKHTGDRPFGCRACIKSFKSKRSLQYHQFISHGIEHSDSNIAQRYQLLRKRRLEETEMQAEMSNNTKYSTQEPINLHKDAPMMSSSPAYFGISPTYHNVSPISTPLDMASKRQRLDYVSTHRNPPLYNSAISATAASHMSLDPRMVQSIDNSYKGTNPEDLSRACQVCTKVFPKPSDLKRHMMCHTGEKPFKCDFCAKPFRAKSSMHYHMKASHGVDIELSPGLEERYLRMKTRAHMNMLQRGHLLGLNPSQASDLSIDHNEIDEIEEDTRSTDSSGLSMDSKSHEQNVITGVKGSEIGDGSSEISLLERSEMDQSNTTLTGYSRSRNISGNMIISSQEPFRRSQISIENETVLITRIDGRDLVNGRNSSVYKCYLCGKFFNTLSNMQCHLSLHFEKQLISYGCCFCDEIFPWKTQMRNHIKRRHPLMLQRKASKKQQCRDSKDMSSSESPYSIPQADSSSAHSKMKKMKPIYTCRYCSEGFSTLVEQNRHFRLHFWNRNCFCRICGKSFQRYISLQTHISRFHWKMLKSSASSSSPQLGRKWNFFSTYRFKHIDHDGVAKGDNFKMKSSKYKAEMISLAVKSTDRKNASIKENVSVVLPQTPLSDNDDASDTSGSHHSSDNNIMSESLSDNAIDSDEIRNAPKRSLMSFRKEASVKSPRRPTSGQSYENENNSPLNFVVKKEAPNQDSNNNESLDTAMHPPDKPSTSSPENLQPLNYPMDASNHLLLAKALAARNLYQAHTSQGLLFPPNLLPHGLTNSPVMTLPVSVNGPPNEPQASKSPSPVSMASSKSDQSPEEKEGTVGYPKVQWSKGMDSTNTNWTFSMYYPESTLNDGRKVSSLSRTHSRLPIVPTPINRESMCKPIILPDGRTVFKCPFCSKDFVSFSDINRHMDFHEDIRPYKCQFCSYYARTNSQLKVHMMRHQGIREYCCKLCNYKGVTQSDLNRHMKSQIHMLKSRNACPFCGEGFVTSKNLEKHLDGNCIVKMQKLNGDLNIHIQESVS